MAVAVALVLRHSLADKDAKPQPQAHTERLETIPLKKKSVGAAPLESELVPQGRFSKFQELTQSALGDLPTIDMVPPTPTSHTGVEPEIFGANEKLAQIHETLAAQPDLVPQGMAFYDTCARNTQVAVAVRAVCLHSLTYWSAKQPDVGHVREQDYDAEVWRLSQMLPPRP